MIEVKGQTGTVRFDGRMVTILRKGFAARTTVGKGEKQIPLRQLTAVQFKPAGPVMNGYIQFSVGGGSERRSKFSRQTSDAVADENSVVFRYSQRKEFEELRDAVQSALASSHQDPGSSPSNGGLMTRGKLTSTPESLQPSPRRHARARMP